MQSTKEYLSILVIWFLLCKKEEKIRKYTCISSFMGGKHIGRIIQRMMILVTYIEGRQKQGRKERIKKKMGDTALSIYF